MNKNKPNQQKLNVKPAVLSEEKGDWYYCTNCRIHHPSGTTCPNK
jgi:hypothetical protein